MNSEPSSTPAVPASPGVPDLTRVKTNGYEYRRSLRLRIILSSAVALALLVAALAFTFALLQSGRTSDQMAAEVQRHCLIDVFQSNQRRNLDLALNHADRAYIAQLERALIHADASAARISLAEITRTRADLAARTSDLPDKRTAANC